jgi:hypothetical protein
MTMVVVFIRDGIGPVGMSSVLSSDQTQSEIYLIRLNQSIPSRIRYLIHLNPIPTLITTREPVSIAGTKVGKILCNVIISDLNFS